MPVPALGLEIRSAIEYMERLLFVKCRSALGSVLKVRCWVMALIHADPQNRTFHTSYGGSLRGLYLDVACLFVLETPIPRNEDSPLQGNEQGEIPAPQRGFPMC